MTSEHPSRRLMGHSGAIVSLIQTGGRTYVRKEAGAATQNARLAAQCSKQRAWHQNGIPCPRILAEGMNGPCYFFEMEYVAGTSVAHQCTAGPPPHVSNLIRALNDINSRCRATAVGQIDAQLFADKLASIKSSSRLNGCLSAVIEEIDARIDCLAAADWRGVPNSLCHGDLTLENVLTTQNGIVYIDFDVPDISSYYFDVGKTFQDLVGNWCLRDVAQEQAGSVLHTNGRLMLSKIAEAYLKDIESDLVRRLPYIVALNLIRALPYCRKSWTARFLIDRIDHTLSWQP